MRLILFRHGHAETRDDARWPDDLARPLVERGVRRASRSARAIARLEPGIRAIYTSPATRARDTAQLLADALDGAAGLHTLAALKPGGTWRDVLRGLAHEKRDAIVALVGHEPDLGKLAGVLLFGASAAMPLKKAGACAIDLGSPLAGRGLLRWSFTPAALNALARKRSRA